MTPTEYRKARKDLRLSQTRLAESLGVNRKTIERRESEAGRITPEMELAIQRLSELLVTGGAIIV